jgi:hypothetical protein
VVADDALHSLCDWLTVLRVMVIARVPGICTWEQAGLIDVSALTPASVTGNRSVAHRPPVRARLHT